MGELYLVLHRQEFQYLCVILLDAHHLEMVVQFIHLLDQMAKSLFQKQSEHHAKQHLRRITTANLSIPLFHLHLQFSHSHSAVSLNAPNRQVRQIERQCT